jgi:tRNA (guanosine-2'-O-)-methyltransferase
MRAREDLPRDPCPSPEADPWPAPWTAERVIEALEPLVLERRRRRFAEVIQARIGSVTVLLDELYDPHNRAAIVRTCDAFGVPELHALQRDGEVLVQRSVATGSERWVDVHRHLTPEDAVKALAARGFELVATDPEGELTPGDLRSIPRVALVLGNEHRGIDGALLRAARRSVKIPMIGFVESLNVSVSAALLLMEATRGRSGDLDMATRQRWYARALFGSVPRAEAVLEALTLPAPAQGR